MAGGDYATAFFCARTADAWCDETGAEPAGIESFNLGMVNQTATFDFTGRNNLKTIVRVLAVFAVIATAGLAQGQDKKPNILFIMGDDIGFMQPGCYHRGLMVGETPNIDRLAREGGLFMDYYAMQSCTSGRCAFFTGIYPVRCGLTVPQLPGSPAWLRPGTPTLAKTLLNLGYTTGQFGKNHLGDHAESLPTAQGFQEYWGYLYHLDAMQQVSFPDINSTPEKQGIAPPALNTPIPGLTPPKGSVDMKTTISMIPPRPILSCTSVDGTLSESKSHQRRSIDAGTVQDGGRRNFRQSHRLARPQRSRQDRQAVLLLV